MQFFRSSNGASSISSDHLGCSSLDLAEEEVLRTPFRSNNGYDYPSCGLCRQGWPWPRNLRYVHVNSDAVQINPRTKDTVVPYLGHNPKTGGPTLPPALFTQLHLVFSRKFMPRALVTEFVYNKKSGRVEYDNFSDDRKGYGYARLMTLNAWWRDLAKAIVQVTINVADLSSNILFLFERLSDSNSENREWTLMFACAWTSAVAIWILCAIMEASKEWKFKAHPNIGDITNIPGALDEWVSYGALVLFFFAGIETLTRDIVIFLHPWKGFQPYAAFKTQGTRAFVVGFQDYAAYKTEINAGQIFILPLRVVCTMMSLTFKVYLILRELSVSGGSSDVYFLIATLSTSLLSTAHNTRKWYLLRLARLEFRVRKRAKQEEEQKEKVYDSSWRDRMFEHRHFFSCRDFCYNLMRAEAKAPPVPEHGCVLCGRVPVDKECAEQRCKVCDPPESGFVTLVKDFKNFGDAKHGILKYGEVGLVVRRSEFVTGYGHRLLVKPRGASETELLDQFSKTWWYDACALRTATADDSFCVDSQINIDDESLAKVREFANVVKLSAAKLQKEVEEFADEFARREALGIVLQAMREGLGGLLGTVEETHLSTRRESGVSSVERVESLPMPRADRFDSLQSFYTFPEGRPPMVDECVQCDFPSPTLCLSSAQALPVVMKEMALPRLEESSPEAAGGESTEPVTPREAALRTTMDTMRHFPKNKIVRHKVLHVAGKKRFGLAILGGQIVRKPESALLLKQLGERVSTEISHKVVIVTASMQGVEQKFKAYCSSHVWHCHLKLQSDVTHYTRDFDFVAGENSKELREALTHVADILIIVEGDKDIAEDAGAAFQLGKKIIPVRKCGGAGGGRHGFPPKALEKPIWAHSADWEHLSDGLNPQATADSVLKLIKQAMRYHSSSDANAKGTSGSSGSPSHDNVVTPELLGRAI